MLEKVAMCSIDDTLSSPILQMDKHGIPNVWLHLIVPMRLYYLKTRTLLSLVYLPVIETLDLGDSR